MPNNSFIFHYDLYYTYCAGEANLAKTNPYQTDNLVTCFNNLGWPKEEVFMPIAHLPYSLWLHSFIACFDFVYVKWAWLLINIILTVFSAYLLLKQSLRNNQLFDYLLLATIFPASLSNIFYGQIVALTLFSFTLFVFLEKKNVYFSSGLVLSLTFFRPHLFLATYCYLIVGWLLTKNWKTPFGVLIGFGLQATLSLAISPKCISYFIARAADISNIDAELVTASLAQQLNYLFGFKQIIYILPFIGIIIGIILSYKANRTKKDFLAPSLCLSLLVAPYAWSHAMLLALPAYIDKLKLLAIYLSREKKFTLFFVLTTIGTILSVRPEIQGIWLLIPIVGLYLSLKNGLKKPTLDQTSPTSTL